MYSQKDKSCTIKPVLQSTLLFLITLIFQTVLEMFVKNELKMLLINILMKVQLPTAKIISVVLFHTNAENRKEIRGDSRLLKAL